MFLLVPAHLGSPGQRAIKWLLCVCLYIEEILLFSKFFSDCRCMPYLRRYSPPKLCNSAQVAIFLQSFCILYFYRAACSTFHTCILSDTVTLNVAGALYTVKRDNGKQCSGLKNHWLTKLEWYRNVFNSRRKVMRDDTDWMTGGRLFQARGAATGNDRSPKVDLLTGWLPDRCSRRGRMDLCRSDSRTSEHKDETVYAVGPATSEDRGVAA